MTVGELIRALSYWSPDTPVQLVFHSPFGPYFGKVTKLDYDRLPDTLEIVGEEK